jgi:hypothetical protein
VTAQDDTRIDHSATQVTIDVQEAPLADVLARIESQTGNHVVDGRAEFGQAAAERRVTLRVSNEPFWAVLDRVLDATTMAPYSYPEPGRLVLIEREAGVLRRWGRAIYPGAFRIEAIMVKAQRGLRSPDDSGVSVELEIAWEPRLQPVGLTQSAADLTVACDDGLELQVASQEDIFDVEVPAGAHAVEVALPLQLPARAARSLQSLRGKLTALVPGRLAELKFDKLVEAKGISQVVGGLTVTLDRAEKNDALWEIHMRIAVDESDNAIETHRGWMFENATFLVDRSGDKVEHAGFETTLQTEREAGFAYLFELPEGREMTDYSWVYRTPAAIVKLPIEYEIIDIPLP